MLAVALLFLAGAISIPVAAIVIDRKMSRAVTIVTPNEPEIIELNRTMWEKGQPVAPIYGTPVGRVIRVVRPDPAEIVVPPEDPSLTLYMARGEKRPLQVQSVYYVAKMTAVPCLVLGLLGLVAWRAWPGAADKRTG